MQNKTFLPAFVMPPFLLLALLLFFYNGTADSGHAQSNQPVLEEPSLSIPANLAAAGGYPITVPIVFKSNGATVTGMLFSIDFDQRCLRFDDNDADNDRIPDAIKVHLTNQHSPSVTYEPEDEDGELDFVIADFLPPLASLPEESTIASIVFTAACQPAASNSFTAAVRFSSVPEASFGDADGRDVIGHTVGGSVRIQSKMPTPTPPLIPGSTPDPIPSPTATPTVVIGNQQPVAEDDLVLMHEDGVVIIHPLTNDRDPDGDPLAFVGMGQGLHGTTAFTVSNGIIYAPATNFYGIDEFFYLITDGQGGQAEGTITVTVRATNDPPRLGDLGNQAHREGDEVLLPLTASDPDHKREELLFSAANLPPELSVDQSRQQIRGVVAIGAAGVYTVTLTVSDTLLSAQNIFEWVIDCLICPPLQEELATYLPLY